MRVRGALIALVCFASNGCFRTVYRNLLPPNMPPAVENTYIRLAPGGWQHFFIYGWVPSEKTIDAAALCGGEEHISAIETRQTFVQGLIQSVAGYYINIYAPYNGRVRCDHSPPSP